MNREIDTSGSLAVVRDLMLASLKNSPLEAMADEYMLDIGIGKMLRARMVIAVGAAAGSEAQRVTHAGAAVEMVHAATLLHDDVIDGGILRRGAPSFWKRHGVQGSILVGDMLLFKAIQLVRHIGDHGLTNELIDLTGEVCMAEIEQELVLRGRDSHSWDDCVSLARRKTGSLFAFSAMAAATEPRLCSALKEAGFLAGTAYQLCDDILDASGDVEYALKSLGSDERRSKTTAVTAGDGGLSVTAEVSRLCDMSAAELADWPTVRKGWQAFMADSFEPVLARFQNSVKTPI